VFFYKKLAFEKQVGYFHNPFKIKNEHLL